MRNSIGLFFACSLFATGCGTDFQAVADNHVQHNMLDKHDKREAIAFLEGGGHFFDDEMADPEDATDVDHQVVLPLLKRLSQISLTDQWAMIRPEKKDSAYGILIGLPRDTRIVDQMAQAVQEADDGFSGFILQQWGHDWLLFDLIDQETYEFLKKSNPDIDKQR